jgi:inorganic pyrophosphatase
MSQSGSSVSRCLANISPFDAATGDLLVVVETPKSSRNKYNYVPEGGYLELATVLPEGMTFPFDFGFIPSTLGEDGDPLDVLVLMDAPVIPACVLHARLLGAIVARQKKPGKKWIRNDRLIAVATHAHTHEGVKTLQDLQQSQLDDIIGFFVDYNRIRNKKFKPQENCGPKKAEKLLQAGMKAFAKREKKHA